jgi:catechol 2,3-dioxygenase-like lactoylglutathione lyase family enzyme
MMVCSRRDDTGPAKQGGDGMRASYRHTNIVAADWRALARFYEDVFGCEPVPPPRDLSGAWLDRGTGVQDAHLSGIHLRLPGHGPGGPTLEIYGYSRTEPRAAVAANREGITHIAFEVDDVNAATRLVLEHGGSRVGDVTSSEVSGVGRLTFVYVADPEGNIIELQAWI